MNPKIKNLFAIVLFFAASVTMLFALPHPRHAMRSPKRPAGSSILLDTSFNTPFFATQVPPGRGVLLPDGKYVLFWNIDTAADHATGPLIRYNADGSFDNTFSFSRDYAGAGPVGATAGGKLIVGAGKIIYGVPNPFQHQISDILRLNGNGLIDPTFGPAQTTDGGEIRVLTINNDGTILIGGLFTEVNHEQINPRQGIVRLLADGTVDPTFAAVTMTCPQFPFGSSGCGVWADPVVDADGKIIIAGDFTAINGTPALCVARLNSNGTLDTTFTASGFVPTGFFVGRPWPIRGIAAQSDGKIVIGGRFNGGNCGNHVPLVRLNTDGSLDTNYLLYTGCLPSTKIGQYPVRNLVKDESDRIIAVGQSMWRFNTDGSLDGAFHNPAFAFAQQQSGGEEGYNVAFADNGTRLFVGGYFSDVDDVGGPPNGERWGAAKFNLDGSLDTTFATSGRTGGKIEPNSFLRQADGFTLTSFAGFITAEHYPAISHGFGRLFSTGALDLTFDPIASFDPNGPLGPNFIGLGFTPFSDPFPDGSLLVTGQYGNTVNYGRLLLPSASEDPSFQADPNVSFAQAFPRGDGKIVLSNYNGNPDIFAEIEPNAQAAIEGKQVQRINSNGPLDNSFHLDSRIVAHTQTRDINGNLTAVYVGSGVLTLTADDTTRDGATLFGYLHSDGTYHLVRLTNDGSLDPDFHEQTFPVEMSFFRAQVNDPGRGPIFVNLYYPDDIPIKQAKNVLDNKVVLMGSFASYDGTPVPGMLRINADGSLDPHFSVGEGAQWTITPETELRHPSIDNLEVGLNSKLLLTGTFEAFNNTPASGIINLNPDGTIDPNFIAPVTREIYDYQPAYLKWQPDGSFLLSGPYSAGNGYSPSFFRLLLPPGVPTPPGADVTVDLGGTGGADDITVEFNGVQNGGTTSVELIDPQWAGELPAGYQIAGANLAFEIWTTATYSPPIEVCFDLSPLDPATFAVARIFHNDGTGLVDVTSSKDPATRTICAAVNSLSPFILLRPTRPTPSPRPRPTPHPRPTPRQ